MGTLSLDVKNHVATLTIESPPANALSTELVHDLDEKLDVIAEDLSVKVVVIKGEGRFFSAGADIKEFTTAENSAAQEELARNGQRIFDRIESYHIPVVAAIHGAALGGGLELAMACHIRIVTREAKLGLPELTLGIIPGFAGTQRLPQHIGHAKAYELILTGEPISGEDAVKLGLANHVVEEDQLLEFSFTLANKIASKSKPTITKIMELVPYAKHHSFKEGVQAEAKAFGEVFGNDDAKEGIQAFIEKRRAVFQDK